MKKSVELKKAYDEIKAQVEKYQQEGKTEEAYAMLDELKAAKQAYEVQVAVENDELTAFKGSAKPLAGSTVDEAKMKNRVFNKLVLGRPLNDEEKQYVDAIGTPGMAEETDEKGGYLVPEEQIATLREYRKAYTALKTYSHVQTANSKSGKMPTLGDESGVLANFEELNAIKQSDFDFGQLAYSINDYGDIIPVSNQLLQDADIDLMSIVGQRFARKSINTENKEILALLGKLSATAITDYKGLTKALNVDLDPVYYANAKILTNQDGLQWLSDLEDGQKRPLLIPDVTAPDTYRFRGKQIVVLSNNTLATADGKIPFYIGSIADYVAFFQRLGVEIAVSTDFLFDKYATALRCVERFGVVADDKDAVKAYSVATA